MDGPITRSPEQQLSDFISTHPLPIPDFSALILDGKPHRFGKGKKGREPHWYVGSRNGEEIQLSVGSHKNPDTKASFQSQTVCAYRPLWKKGATISEKWSSCKRLDSHPYLANKGIISGLFGAKINYFGDLVVPMNSIIDGKLVGLQTIKENGKKLFVPGSKKNYSYFEIEGSFEKTDVVYVAEGFATAITVYIATNTRVICAFDCANLPKILEILSKKEPNSMIIVAGDDDRFGRHNAGRHTAKAVSKVAPTIFPKFATDEGKPTDWNDLHVLEGLDEVERQIKRSYSDLTSFQNKSKEKKTLTVIDNIQMGCRCDYQNGIKKTKDWVLPSLQRGHVGLLCSPGGYGKSSVAQLIVSQIASGGKKDFLGLGELVGGSAVFLSLEDCDEVFFERQNVITKDCNDQERKLLDSNLQFINALSVQNSVSSDRIVTLIQDKYSKSNRDLSSLRLLVVDHLSYWSSLDLNDPNSAVVLMKDFKKISQKLNCAILVLHHTNRSSMIKGKEKQRGSATMGGSYKFHSLSRFVAFIEDPERISKGEDEEKRKTFAVDKASHGKKYRLELQRRDARCGLLYKIGFGSGSINEPQEFNSIEANLKKEILDLEVMTSEEPSIKTPEEINIFNFSEASPYLLTVPRESHPIMRWLLRNPAFETVDTNKRKLLTKIMDGEEIDIHRENPSVYKDVWIKGDRLVVRGPICDQEDMKLYALLVRELLERHKNGQNGLTLFISLNNISRLKGYNKAGKTIKKLKRQLARLTEMNLYFKCTKGQFRRGPLITGVAGKGEGSATVLLISFSHFMIDFYKAHEYSLLEKKEFWELSGDSASLFAFYSSQEFRKQSISFSQVENILGMSEDITKKASRRRIKKAYEKLVEIGFFDADHTSIGADVIHTHRSNKAR